MRRFYATNSLCSAHLHLPSTRSYLRRGPRGRWPGPLAPGQVDVTDAEYAAIMTATIEEVWSRYPGALTEVWVRGATMGVATMMVLLLL